MIDVEEDWLRSPPAEAVPESTAGSLPLSFAQTRLWVLSRYEPDTALYNLPWASRIRGRLDAGALEASLTAIRQRHEVLRTIFAAGPEGPETVIAAAADVKLACFDVSGLPDAPREAEAVRLAEAEAAQPFDLELGPLFRARLIKLAAEDHLLVLNLHHIVADGWSQRVLYRDLSALYRAQLDRSSPALPELPIQYADYAIWQRAWLQGEELQQKLANWRRRLEGAPPALELPTDRPRPQLQGFQGAVATIRLDKPLVAALKDLTRKNRATLFITLLAGFKAVLHRYSGQQDIVVGTHSAGRNLEETEDLIGCFINTLALRTDLSGNPSFRDLLVRVRGTALDAYDHQDLPFENLLEELQPERSLSHTPLVQVVFNMLNLRDAVLNLPGATVEHPPLVERGAKFDLTIYAKEGDEGVAVKAIYNADLFEPATIARLLGHYSALLESAAADPDCRLSRLALGGTAPARLAAAGRRVHPTRAFDVFPATEESIPQRFASQVRRNPKRLAIKSRQHAWTYAELDQAAERIARALSDTSGPAPQTTALLFGHGAPMIAAMLGALKAGWSYVPLAPDQPTDSLAYMLEDSGAQTILTDAEHLALAGRVAGERLRVLDVDRLPARPGLGAAMGAVVAPDAIAYILYTSGSTGRPKGVVQNHRNVMHFIRAYTNNLHINADDRLTLLASYGFDAAVMDIYAALLNGATLYPMDLKLEGLADLASWLVEHEITVYHSTPTVYRYFTAALSAERFPALRLVVLGGEEVFKRDVDVYKRHFAQDCIFVNGLGPTESTVSLQYFIDKRTEMTRNAVPVGQPVEETDVLLLDGAGEPTELFGEIALKSPYVALGYWRNAELTAARFLPDGGGGPRRIYRTGDLGRTLPDGGIEFVGRKDQQVKIRGYRVEPGGIEAALAAHPAVRECAVAVREDQPGEKRLVAYAVLREGREAGPSELRDFAQSKLPDYMVPAAIVLLDRLPLTQNRKLDHRALPAPTYQSEAAAFVAPRTPNERAIAAIWAELLNVGPVGVHDSFFELGGHSLLATRVVSRIRATLQTDLPLRALFERPTVAGLALAITEAQARVDASP